MPGSQAAPATLPRSWASPVVFLFGASLEERGAGPGELPALLESVSGSLSLLVMLLSFLAYYLISC